MKLKKINLFIFLLLANSLIFISCKSNPADSPSDIFSFNNLTEDEINKLLLGKWEWTYAEIMSRNIQPPDNIITPETAGYTMQRIFKPDNQVDYYKNNQLINTYTYEIKKFKILPDDDNYQTLVYINNFSYQLLFSYRDNLMIGNGWSDGVNNYFLRND